LILCSRIFLTRYWAISGEGSIAATPHLINY